VPCFEGATLSVASFHELTRPRSDSVYGTPRQRNPSARSVSDARSFATAEDSED